MTEQLPDGLEGLKLTEEGREPRKETDVVHEIERIKALQDPVRIQILEILRIGIDDTLTSKEFNEETNERITREKAVRRHALSIAEIIEISKNTESFEELTKNQVYHHLTKLIESEFVIRYGWKLKGKRRTDYYRRKAKGFITFGMHYPPDQLEESIRKEIQSSMKNYRVDFTEQEMKKFIDLMAQNELMRYKSIGIIQDLVQGDVTEANVIDTFEWLLWIYATGQDEYLKNLTEIRKMLFKK